MTQKEFTNLMNRLLELKKDEERLNKALKVFSPDFDYLSLGRIETLIVDAIKAGMNDTNDWLGWWLWEMNYGKDIKKDSVFIKGKNVPCKTLKDLYNLITK